MTDENRPSTGTTRAHAVAKVSDEWVFPAHLLQRSQSQVEQYEDSVTDRVVRLDERAQVLGASFGLTFTSFVLNPLPEPRTDSGVAALAEVLRAFTHRAERVTLERRASRWGLYFTREPAVLAQDRKSDTVPLKDAPLDVRQRFLVQSEQFFRAYLDLCEERLGRMGDAVARGDRTLRLLLTLRAE